jgi:putative transcriptional regulator
MIATMPSRGRMLTNRLSRLMGERRLTITDVADGAGLHWNTVAELYHDRASRLDIATLEKLCDYFDVGPSEVFEYRRGRRTQPRVARRRAAAGTPGATPGVLGSSGSRSARG